jgi:polar amino acid transport system substrate-binding protein
MRSVAALVAAVVAFAAPAAAETRATVEPGVLTVALNLPSPGFQAGAVRPDGTVVAARGFEIDLARSLAARLGLARVRFVNDPSFRRIVARGEKPWDVALASVTITLPRRRNVDFSVPYLQADQGVLLRGGVATPRSIDALAKLKLCVQRGTTAVDAVAERVKPARPPFGYANVDLLLEAVRTGRCDAAILDAPILAAERAGAPYRYGPLAGVLKTQEHYGVVLERGSQLTPQVSAAVKALVANGTVAKLQRRWLSTDLTKLPVLG